MTKPITKYNRTTITLHWLTVLAMFLAIFFIEIHGLFPKGSATRDLTKVIHISFGFLILGLALARLIVRHFTTVPAIEPPMPAWMEKASKAVHHLLLLLMIVIPMLGWLYMSARGRVSPFFGFDILAIMPQVTWAKDIKGVHELLGNVIMFVIAAHAGAALFHHYVIKDNTLLRMMPGKKEKTPK